MDRSFVRRPVSMNQAVFVDRNLVRPPASIKHPAFVDRTIKRRPVSMNQAVFVDGSNGRRKPKGQPVWVALLDVSGVAGCYGFSLVGGEYVFENF